MLILKKTNNKTDDYYYFFCFLKKKINPKFICIWDEHTNEIEIFKLILHSYNHINAIDFMIKLKIGS